MIRDEINSESFAPNKSTIRSNVAIKPLECFKNVWYQAIDDYILIDQEGFVIVLLNRFTTIFNT